MVTEAEPTFGTHKIFLHFFDIHFLEARGITPQSKAALREASLASRLAILAADEVIIPAASYLESSVCYSIIEKLSPLFPFGMIRLAGGGESIQEFSENKLIQYPYGSEQYEIYTDLEYINLPAFLSRQRSATRDIKEYWLEILESLDFPKNIFGERGIKLPKNLEKRWENLPNELGRAAFIVKHIIPRLFNRKHNGENISIRNRLHSVINKSYFESYTREFSAGTVKDLAYLEINPPIGSFGADISYRNLFMAASEAKLLPQIENDSALGLFRLKTSDAWKKLLTGVVGVKTRQEQLREELKKSGNLILPAPTQPNLFPYQSGRPASENNSTVDLNNLDGKQTEELCNILARAFDRDSLERMVKFGLDENLENVAAGNTLPGIVFKLVEWSQRHGKLTVLLKAAREQNPGNVALELIAAKLLK